MSRYFDWQRKKTLRNSRYTSLVRDQTYVTLIVKMPHQTCVRVILARSCSNRDTHRLNGQLYKLTYSVCLRLDRSFLCDPHANLTCFQICDTRFRFQFCRDFLLQSCNCNIINAYLYGWLSLINWGTFFWYQFHSVF